MKRFKKLFALLLCLVLTISLGAGAAFAKKKDDDEDSDDYSVSDVYFDISDTAIYVGWAVGDGECKYTVQLYDSSDFKTKNKVGSAVTVGYNAEMVDVTQKILNEGSGTYYALVTCKKKPKGASSYASAYARETIYSDDLSTIRKNRKEAAKESSSGSSSGTGVSGVDGGPGVSGAAASAGTSAGTSTGTSAGISSGTSSNAAAGESGSWQALDDGKWLHLDPQPDGRRRLLLCGRDRCHAYKRRHAGRLHRRRRREMARSLILYGPGILFIRFPSESRKHTARIVRET